MVVVVGDTTSAHFTTCSVSSACLSHLQALPRVKLLVLGLTTIPEGQAAISVPNGRIVRRPFVLRYLLALKL